MVASLEQRLLNFRGEEGQPAHLTIMLGRWGLRQDKLVCRGKRRGI